MKTTPEKNRKAPPRHRPGEPTLKEIGAALNLSIRRISQLHQAGMPVRTIAEAISWRAEQEGAATGDDSVAELRKRRIALLRQQERLAKIAADEKAGLLVSRAACRESWTKLGVAMQGFWRALERELPAAVLGLPLDRSIPIAKQLIRKQQGLLTDRESEFWAAHPETSK